MTATTKRKRNPPPKGHHSWEDYAEMGAGCLDMIRTALERLGEQMTSTPPMFYDDAIMCAVFRRRKQMVDALSDAARLLEHGAQSKTHVSEVLATIKEALRIKTLTECKRNL